MTDLELIINQLINQLSDIEARLDAIETNLQTINTFITDITEQVKAMTSGGLTTLLSNLFSG